jgi:4-amino-4-deoxy-L-arabinose transferase-like glycosyltransferase
VPAPRVARRIVVAMVVAALGVRLALAFAAPFPHIDGDPAVYDEIAVALASGEGIARLRRRPDGEARPTALHPPGWPALLGLTYAVRGHAGLLDRVSAARTTDPEALDRARARWRAGRVVQALLGAAAVALIGIVGWQLWGAGVAVIAAGLGALHAPLAVLGLALLAEPLFVVLELGALAAVLRYRARGGLGWVLLAGVLLGACTLTRNNGIVLAVPLALGVWTGRPRRSLRALAVPLALVTAAVLTVVTWTIRNAVVLNGPVPVATNLGQTLAGTYNAESAGHYYRWRSPRLLAAERRRELRAMSEPERSASLARDGLRYIRAHPASPLVVSLENTARLAEADHEARSTLASVVGSRPLARASIAGFALFTALAVAGAFTRRARAAPRFVWLMPLLMWASVVPLAVNFSRFRAPLDPFAVLLAALALDALRAAVRRRPPEF